MNSLFQQLQNQKNLNLQQNNPRLSTLKNNISQIKTLLKSSNPEELLQTMSKDNPQMQNVLQAFQNSKMTPKQFFYQYTKQMGIDPDQILDLIK